MIGVLMILGFLALTTAAAGLLHGVLWVTVIGLIFSWVFIVGIVIKAFSD